MNVYHYLFSSSVGLLRDMAIREGQWREGFKYAASPMYVCTFYTVVFDSVKRNKPKKNSSNIRKALVHGI